MSSPFVGQLSCVGFNFPPSGWAFADGQLLPLSQNTALFSLLGTYYGGDGRSTFALPNLQGAVPLSFGQLLGGSYYDIGQSSGSDTVTLLQSETPPHSHTFSAKSTLPIPTVPTGNSLADAESGNIYSASTTPLSQLSGNAVSTFGSSQPHNNLMPYLTLNWIIALQGVYPPRT